MQGPRNRPLPGGQCAEKPDEATEKIKPTAIVPAMYHEGPPALPIELAHLVDARAIIDLSPGGGHWIQVALRRRIPYLGVCHSPTHCTMLRERALSRVLVAKLDSQDDDFYDSKLSDSVTKHTQGKSAGEKRPDPKNQQGGPDPKKPKLPDTKPEPEKGSESSTTTPKNPRDELMDRIQKLKDGIGKADPSEDITI